MLLANGRCTSQFKGSALLRVSVFNASRPGSTFDTILLPTLTAVRLP